MQKLLTASLCLLLGACASHTKAPADVVADLAPGNTLRAAINFGNPILARKDANGDPQGVSVDLSRELAKRLGVGVELVPYTAAGQVVRDVKTGNWTIAFNAIDPARAADIDYSAAYVVIEGAYLVKEGSPLKANEDVDRDGIRVAVGNGSAYDLHLARELKKARIERAATSPEVTDFFLKGNLDVAAGVKQQLEADTKRLPGLRLLPGRFMVINQAMAVPKGKPAGAKYVAAFVEEMKASGFVAEALKRHSIEGAQVAPPGPAAAAPKN
jgi:polar amino acid transport system substrate-binding protein